MLGGHCWPDILLGSCAVRAVALYKSVQTSVLLKLGKLFSQHQTLHWASVNRIILPGHGFLQCLSTKSKSSCFDKGHRAVLVVRHGLQISSTPFGRLVPRHLHLLPELLLCPQMVLVPCWNISNGKDDFWFEQQFLGRLEYWRFCQASQAVRSHVQYAVYPQEPTSFSNLFLALITLLGQSNL